MLRLPRNAVRPGGNSLIITYGQYDNMFGKKWSNGFLKHRSTLPDEIFSDFHNRGARIAHQNNFVLNRSGLEFFFFFALFDNAQWIFGQAGKFGVHCPIATFVAERYWLQVFGVMFVPLPT